ncbi:ecdysteroid-regulated 16 kDa protein [Chrysoperla carnea]|uniref:ecdysteroid-regulated 16 kDa protein n=1 Tax=Chrysoperla carnea TaxID=189513 RepID=UPI001D05E31F|nr:ecdysteroid-regulated 16 kDa protein [Chrysoperla carnea]
MFSLKLFVLLSCLCLNYVYSTTVKNCQTGAQSKASPEDLSAAINIVNCDKPPCKLVRKTTTHIEAKFTPSEDVENLVDSVQAIIGGVPLPFIGVDGSSVCSKILLASDGSKAECPLKAGTEYIYKDQFDVLAIYPKIQAVVHWALQSDKKDILCFEVPIKIV